MGNQLPETGTQIGSTEVYEYSYLSGQVVHLVGNAKHGTNDTQINYIINYFSDCSPTIDLGENYIGKTDNHHFKTRSPE